ncbi:MAG: thermitase [Solirubrobacteraceae bacterium]|nr:thermitase [Solirubrobacteraceae bacterium]
MRRGLARYRICVTALTLRRLLAPAAGAVACSLSLLALWSAPAAAAHPGGPIATTEPEPSAVVVRFASGVDAEERAAVRRAADVSREERLPVPGMEVVDPAPGVSVEESVAALERSEDVVYAEPDAGRRAFVTPDDRYFGLLWGLRNTGQVVGGTAGAAGADIDAEPAWATTVGSRDVVVGVVDSGVDVAHPDLAPNRWSDPGETGDGRETNGIDDDGDGLIDDAMGWDWVQADNQPLDENGHGTHVAGTIGANGNDANGVVGVAWQAGLMPLRVLDANGSGRVSDVVQAYGYAARHGARVVNASLGGDSFSRAERDAIAAAPGVLFVVAAGNDGADNDAVGSYPCNYGLENIVCVAASDQSDRLASFSNYGASTVDIAAPGVNVASAWPNAAWSRLDGTSMATPHVAGAAVLALAANPRLSTAELRDALLSSADPVPSLAGRVATGARLNAAVAVAVATGAPRPRPQAMPSPGPAPAPAPAPAPTPAPAPQPAPPPTQPAAPAPAALPVPSVPARAPDRLPPGTSVAVATRASLRPAVTRGVHVRVRCSERCAARLRLVLDGRTARRLGLSDTGHAVVLARGEGRLTRAGALTRRLRPGPGARRRLLRAASVRLTVRADVHDRAGNRRSRTAQTLLRAR